MTGPDDLDLVMQLERELQTPDCRRDAARLDELLAHDFVEVGASGTVWDRPSTLGLLDGEPPDGPEIRVHHLTARSVGPGFVIVRWDSDRGGRRARRTSLWRREPAGWRLVHHQGTRLAGPAEEHADG